MGDVGAAGNARGGIPGTMTQQSGADCGVTVASFVRRARAAAWAAVPMRAAPPAIAAAGLGPGPSVVILDFVDTRRLRICDKAAGRRSAPKVPLPHRAKSHPTPPGRPKKVQVRGGMRFCRDRQDRDQYPQVPESRLGIHKSQNHDWGVPAGAHGTAAPAGMGRRRAAPSRLE